MIVGRASPRKTMPSPKLGKNEPGSSPSRAACLGEAMSETASSPQAAACDIPLYAVFDSLR